MMSDGLVCAECKKVCANRKAWLQHRRRSGHGFQRPERRQPIRSRECRRRRRSAAESSRNDGDRTTTACGGGLDDAGAGAAPATAEQSGGSSKRSKTKHGTPVVVAGGGLTDNGWVFSRRTNSDNSCYFKHVSGARFKSRRTAVQWAERNNMAPPRGGRLSDLRTKVAHGRGLSMYFAKKTTNQSQCANAKPFLRRAFKPTKQCEVCLSKANPIAVLRCVDCDSAFPSRRKKKRTTVALRQAPAPVQGTVLFD